MRSDLAIRTEGISKRYRLREAGSPYLLARDAIGVAARRAVRRAAPPPDDAWFWALDDVDFEVTQGEVVGLIGRNGAGKSTLLKVIARITEPTKGVAEIRGRVGSLLEVGTGFHPELTGRENTFLSGAILGMSRREVAARLDEIVAFAGVERFLDLPMKRYSSGMQLRLAFAVAAHIEPEILLVDEVLAVGDLAFQRKCLGKMHDVAGEGRTVLFVSHNLAVLKDLCQTGVVIEHGRVGFRGPIGASLSYYAESLRTVDVLAEGRSGFAGLTINGEVEPVIDNDQAFTVEAVLRLDRPIVGGSLYCIVEDPAGRTVVHERIDVDEAFPGGLDAGVHGLRLAFPPLWLAPTIYAVYLKVARSVDSEGNAVAFQSERLTLDIEVQGDGSTFAGAAVAPRVDWQVT